jgi:5-methylthioadenosine/S-adenosylhomocysteine deaminase
MSACSSESAVIDGQEIDLITYGRWVVTMDGPGTIIENGAVAVTDGAILAVGPAAEIDASYKARKTLSGEDRVLMPGLVNGHTHAAMVLFRGMADDLELMDWLQNYIFPMEGQFVSEEFVKIGAELACLEMLRGGTTSIVDMYFYPQISGEVYERCGLRAMLGTPMIDFPSPGFTGWEDSYASGVDFVKTWRSPSGRVRAGLAPHAPYTVAPDHLRDVVEMAGQLNAPITMHLAEDRSETNIIEQRYGTSPVRHVAALGMLDTPMIAAHMVWPDEEEIAMLAKSKVSAIHNPTSNMKLGAGISPVPAMIAAGVKVGLGTDGAASNNDLDMWEEIRLAALLHKVDANDPTAMPAEMALRLATSMGADAVGLGETTGSLEVGKRADMIQIDMSDPRLQPIYDVLSHLVYVVRSSDVVTTIIDGQVVVENGEVTTLDAADIKARVLAKADEIRAALQAAEQSQEK